MIILAVAYTLALQYGDIVSFNHEVFGRCQGVVLAQIINPFNGHLSYKIGSKCITLENRTLYKQIIMPLDKLRKEGNVNE